MGCSSSSPLSLPIVNSPAGIKAIGAPSFPTISPGGCGIVAAFGGAVPLGGCVALAGGFAGATGEEAPGSFVPSAEEGAAGLAGGFTSPSCTCCLEAGGGG